MNETAIELHDPAREVKELRMSVTALDLQVRQLQKTVDNQADALRHALAAVFHRVAEELGASSSAPVAAPGSNAKWESWKQRLGGKAPVFIDLLLVHGELSAAQFMSLAKCAKRTVYDTTYAMSKAGILSKAGSKYRLKEI